MTAKKTAPKPEPVPTKVAVQVAPAPTLGNFYTTTFTNSPTTAPYDIVEAAGWYSDVRGELWLEDEDGAEVKRYAAGHWYNVQFHKPS